MVKFYNTLFIHLFAVFAFVGVFTNNLQAQECGVIYVVPNGAPNGAAGTRANPANLAYGLTLVSPANPRLWLNHKRD